MIQPSLAELGRIVDRCLAATAWKPTEMEIRLFQNDITPDIDTVLADFTIADYDGYASLDTIDMQAKSLSNDGNYQSVSKVAAHFLCTGDTTVNTIYGMYLLDFAGNLIGSARFDDPQVMAKAGDAISFAIQLEPTLTGNVVIVP